jgi:hypothetical protein
MNFSKEHSYLSCFRIYLGTYDTDKDLYRNKYNTGTGEFFLSFLFDLPFLTRINKHLLESKPNLYFCIRIQLKLLKIFPDSDPRR